MSVTTCSRCGQQFGPLTALVAHYTAVHGDPYGHCEPEPETRIAVAEQYRVKALAYRTRRRLERVAV